MTLESTTTTTSTKSDSISGRLTKAIDDADRLEGWSYPRELRWLGQQAAHRKTIVEVGSWKGRSTKVLAAMCPGTVYSVDDLTGQVSDEYGRVGKREQNRELRHNLAEEISEGKVVVIQTSSAKAAEQFEDGSVDMVYIDGGHFYPDPLIDVQAWLPKLDEDGLMCGHDWTHEGVRRSLQEAPGQFEPANSYDKTGSIWVRL